MSFSRFLFYYRWNIQLRLRRVLSQQAVGCQFVIQAGYGQADDIVVVSADSAYEDTEGALDAIGARLVVRLLEGNLTLDLTPVHGKNIYSCLLAE